MTTTTWPERLQCLAARLPGLGLGADLTALTTAELWGLYRFLSRLADGA
ncbi:MAG: hypothetical protein IH627_05110 [Rubrivivax sp.]|nr:hypothetical protein [Rubrivivax sp.]